LLDKIDFLKISNRCYRPEGFRANWIGLNENEFVHMGPNREKLSLKNITAGLKRGNTFGSPDVWLYQVKPAFEVDLNFAPGYVWKNKEKLAYLLLPETSYSDLLQKESVKRRFF